MSVVRNLVIVVVAAVPTAAALSPFFSTAPGVTVVTPTTPTTTPTTPPTTPPASTPPTVAPNSGSGVVISNAQTNCTVPNNDNVKAAKDFTNDILVLRSTLGLPVQLDPQLSGIAAFDIPDMAANNYLGTVNSKGQTLIQRVQAAVPSAKAAAEIIVKGCFGNNTDVDIINLMTSDASAVAILRNPNWTHFGISEQPDFSQGTPDRGIYWVVIFAQE